MSLPEPKYTREQIHNAIIEYHKEIFGYISDEKEPRDAYFISGFVMGALSSLDKIATNPEKT